MTTVLHSISKTNSRTVNRLVCACGFQGLFLSIVSISYPVKSILDIPRLPHTFVIHTEIVQCRLDWLNLYVRPLNVDNIKYTTGWDIEDIFPWYVFFIHYRQIDSKTFKAFNFWHYNYGILFPSTQFNPLNLCFTCVYLIARNFKRTVKTFGRTV